MKKIITITISIITIFLGLGAIAVNAQDTTTTPTPTVATTTEETETESPTPSNMLLQKTEVETENQQERMQKAITMANQWITERITSLQEKITQIQSLKSSISNTTLAQSVISSLEQDITGLNALKTQIDAFNDPTNVKGSLLPLIQEIFTNFRIYAIGLPQAEGLIHTIYAQNAYTKFVTVGTNMNKDITFAQSQGKDVTTITADYNKFLTDNAKLNTDIQTAQTQIATLTPASFQKGESIVSQFKPLFESIHQDIENVQSDFKQFKSDYLTLFGLK